MSQSQRRVTCEVCGDPLIGRQRRYCSQACKRKAKHRRDRRGSQRSCGPDRICEVCGETYPPTYRAQRTCGRECGAWLKRGYPSRVLASERLHGQCSKLPAVKQLKLQRRCKKCGAPVEWKKQYCPECRDEVGRQNRREAKRRSHRPKNARQRFAGKHRRRARMYGCEYEPIDPKVVYDRDGWRCHICGKPIPWGAAQNAPMAPSIDHVWPMSKGGPHTYGNVRAAHRICNILKSDDVPRVHAA